MFDCQRGYIDYGNADDILRKESNHGFYFKLKEKNQRAG